MKAYSQFYHCMEGERGNHQFQSEQIYTSPLRISTQTSKLPRQTNGTDCGIFTLMYQQTLSNWYRVHVGLEFTEARIQVLIQDLQTVTPAWVREHRKWLRQNMHKWWQDRWVEPTPIAPQGIVHQSSTPEETTGPTKELEEGGDNQTLADIRWECHYTKREIPRKHHL